MADYDRLNRYGRDARSGQNPNSDRGYEGQGRFGRESRNDDRYANQGNYGGSSAQYGQYDQGSSDQGSYGRDDYGRGSSYGQGRQGQGRYDQDRSRNRYGQSDQSGHHSGYGNDYRDQGSEDRYASSGRDYRSSYGDDYNRGGAGSFGGQSSYSRRENSFGRGYSADDRSGNRSGYGQSGYGQSGYGQSDDDRGFFERAGDEVRSWFGDDDAERRRRQDAYQGDEGAQHHRGRGPRNYSRSDDRVREDVNDRLTDDAYLDASDIDVSVSGGEVTLTGTVNNRSDKRRAEDVAERVSGVSHVQNNLRVKQGSSSSTTSLMGSTMGGNNTVGTSSLAGMSGTSEAGSSAAASGTKLGGLASTSAEATTQRKAT